MTPNQKKMAIFAAIIVAVVVVLILVVKVAKIPVFAMAMAMTAGNSKSNSSRSSSSSIPAPGAGSGAPSSGSVGATIAMDVAKKRLAVASQELKIAMEEENRINNEYKVEMDNAKAMAAVNPFVNPTAAEIGRFKITTTDQKYAPLIAAAKSRREQAQVQFDLAMKSI